MVRSKDQTRTNQLLELLYHSSRRAATALDLRVVLQQTLYEVTRNVGGERCSVAVLDDQGKVIDATIVYGATTREHTTLQLREPMERGLAGWVARNRQGVYIPNTSQDERWTPPVKTMKGESQSKSAICVPLLAREKLVGVLTLVHSKINAFSAEQLDLVQAIADQTSVSILNARLYAESQRRTHVMTALAEGATAINVSLQIEELHQRILTQAIQALQVETVALGMIDGGRVVFRAATGRNAENIIGRQIVLGEGIAGLAARNGRGVVVQDTTQEKDFSEADTFDGVEMRAFLVAPIQAQGRVIGILEAINPTAELFDPDALLVTTGIGGLAGAAIQNAQLFERLQAAHRRYRELFEESVVPMLITDWEGRIVETNQQAKLLSGYAFATPFDLTIDQLHDVNWDKLGANFAALREDRTIIYESTLRARNDARIPIEVFARRIEFEEADSIQWILRDIAERKNLDNLRSDLTSMIYHDLRSPLANIAASLDILHTLTPGKDRETILSLIQIVENSTDRIQRLVNSLLDINQLEAGQPVANQKPVDALQLIRRAMADIQPLADGQYQTIEAKLPQTLPPVWVDEDMAYRVLINLLENASKFTPAKGSIEIGAQREGDWALLWVQDTGPGIPLSERERIFDKFMRLPGTSQSGLGIGLAFCRLAVQGHGGRIWLESDESKGAKFYFTFPLASA